MGGCTFHAGHAIDKRERGFRVGDILVAGFGADKDIGDLIINDLFSDALPDPVEQGGQEDHVGKAHPDNQDSKDHARPAAPLKRPQGKQERYL
jgi:hypothetical protein